MAQFTRCPHCGTTVIGYADASGKLFPCPVCNAAMSAGAIADAAVPPVAQRPKTTPLPAVGAAAAPTAAADPVPAPSNQPSITFACPACRTVYQVPVDSAGKKSSCRKCGQRIEVPRPPPAKTVLGEVVAGAAFGSPMSPFAVQTSPIALEPGPIDVDIAASSLASEPSSPFAGFDAGTGGVVVSEPTRSREPLKHCGLGIASFLIALLVGGLDVILIFVTAIGIGTTAHAPEMAMNFIGGLTALIFLNCASVPLCLVGVGLGIVGLIAHRGSNHVFTWIGLMGNAAIIITLLTLYVIGAVAKGVAEKKAIQPPPPKINPWKGF